MKEQLIDPEILECNTIEELATKITKSTDSKIVKKKMAEIYDFFEEQCNQKNSVYSFNYTTTTGVPAIITLDTGIIEFNVLNKTFNKAMDCSITLSLLNLVEFIYSSNHPVIIEVGKVLEEIFRDDNLDRYFLRKLMFETYLPLFHLKYELVNDYAKTFFTFVINNSDLYVNDKVVTASHKSHDCNNCGNCGTCKHDN